MTPGARQSGADRLEHGPAGQGALRDVPGPQLNPGLAEVRMTLAGRTATSRVVKTQPPDGLVLQLDDGSKWAVNAYRQDGAP